MKTKRTYYDILNVNQNSNFDTIKKSYYQLAMKYHPDKNINNKEESEMLFKDLLNAYLTLSDKKLKKEYDKKQLMKNQICTLDQQNNINNFSKTEKNHIDMFKKVFGLKKFFNSYDKNQVFSESKLGNCEYIETEFDFGNGNIITKKCFIKNGVKSEETYENQILINKKISSSLNNFF